MLEFLSQEPIRLGLFILGVIAFVGLNAAYLVLLERKVAAWIQRRAGPYEVGPWGLFQPLADIVKMLTKQIVLPNNVDPLIYRFAPAAVMLPAVMGLMTIPFSSTLVGRNINLGVLMILAFGSINVVATMLGGWASRNKYSILASARIVAQNVAYEIPMYLVVIAVAMLTRSFDLQEIVRLQAGPFWHWNIFQLHHNPLMPLSFVIFFICMLAETNRAPFDMYEAESELIAGAYTEYSGMAFGVFFMAEYANIVLGCSLMTVLFLGGWQCPFGLFPGLHWFLLKLYGLICIVVWIRWTYPRVQFYSLLNLSWKILIPFALLNLVLTSVMVKIL